MPNTTKALSISSSLSSSLSSAASFETLSLEQIKSVTGGMDMAGAAGMAANILPQIGNMVGGEAGGWLNKIGGLAGNLAGGGGGGGAAAA